jgi:hypothetical protein
MMPQLRASMASGCIVKVPVRLVRY